MKIPSVRKWRVEFRLDGAVVAEGEVKTHFPFQARSRAIEELESQNARVKETGFGVVVDRYDTIAVTALA